jgi:DnaJ family protein C protein 19
MRFIAFAALGVALWFLWKRFMAGQAPMSVTDAAKLLDVAPDATPDEVIAAHKRLIAKVHPDTGGSADLAARVNQARDVLLRNLSN